MDGILTWKDFINPFAPHCFEWIFELKKIVDQLSGNLKW